MKSRKVSENQFRNVDPERIEQIADTAAQGLNSGLLESGTVSLQQENYNATKHRSRN